MQTKPELTQLSRDKHGISRKDIAESALKVLYRLSKAGYRACLVGGGVRDLLLNRHPKDFDVATDATPDQVNELFRNCRLIGRRFRLAHIRYGREIIEVATFRAHKEDAQKTKETLLHDDGRILRDNTFGQIDEDAIRRDFTVNALYYDIKDFSVLDYTNGLDDIKNKTIRLIGDPATRYKEDPVRMLRAVRFAAKLDFIIEENAARQIFELGHLLSNIPAARLFDELLKLFHSGHASRSYELLRHYDLLQYLLPATDAYLKDNPQESMLDFIDRALFNTDERINRGLKASPAFIYAVFLWPVVILRAKRLESDQLTTIPALQKSAAELFIEQVQVTAIPKRFSQVSKDIWILQNRFQRTRGKQPGRLTKHPSFRAAYDFMCIASQTGIVNRKICHWWTEYQEKHPLPEKPKRHHFGRHKKNKSNDRNHAST